MGAEHTSHVRTGPAARIRTVPDPWHYRPDLPYGGMWPCGMVAAILTKEDAMRLSFALLFIVGFVGQASADCVCRCVDGKVTAICTSPTDANACATSSCPAVSTRTPAAGITSNGAITTVPPSTTGPENSAPLPLRSEPFGESRPGSGIPRSITRGEAPAPTQPSPTALCYQRHVFNPGTQSYEWQEVCD